jgi:hypothetical protein
MYLIVIQLPSTLLQEIKKALEALAEKLALLTDLPCIPRRN